METDLINVKNLNKSFAGKPAVIDVSLQVKAGEIFGFLGPNGSGKTTTMRMLCGLLTPDSGSGTCLGYDLFTDAAAIKRQIGYVSQSFSFYKDLTVYENLDFMTRVYQIKNRKQVIHDFLEKMGLVEYTHQIVATLSGGWRQRLALTAALIHQPRLLLLDEPTAGVDPKTRRDFWNYIQDVTEEGVSAVVSTHYMDEAERCHRLAYIAYGHMLASGTPDDIVQQAGLHAWRVRGDNLIPLEQQLKQMPGVEQVAFFGNALHICGKDKQQLEQTIARVKMPAHQWEAIQPSLEDVFIGLIRDVGTAT